MYEVKKASQLRRFFKHNDSTEQAMDIIFDWLEKVNANFKDEEDFETRMPKIIEKYLVSEQRDEYPQVVVAEAYFGKRERVYKYMELLDNYRAEKKKEAEAKKAQQTKKTQTAKTPEEPKKQEQPRRVRGTEKLYGNGNTEIYKTTIDDEPTIMILLRNYSTDDFLKAMVREMIDDFFSFF